MHIYKHILKILFHCQNYHKKLYSLILSVISLDGNEGRSSAPCCLDVITESDAYKLETFTE